MNLKQFLEELNTLARVCPELLDLPVFAITGSPIEAVIPYHVYVVASNTVITVGIKLTYADY